MSYINSCSRYGRIGSLKRNKAPLINTGQILASPGGEAASSTSTKSMLFSNILIKPSKYNDKIYCSILKVYCKQYDKNFEM